MIITSEEKAVKALSGPQRIVRAHVLLGRHQMFAMLSGIMLMGKSEIRDNIPTAYTNGRDKFYGRKLLMNLPPKQFIFVVAHENFHVLLKQLTTWKSLWKQDPERANMAADYVINLMIKKMDPNESILQVPSWVLCDDMFDGWDTRRVFKYLGSNNPQPSKPEAPPDWMDGIEGFDAHGWQEADGMTAEDKKDLDTAIDAAIRQGQILAGKLGALDAERMAGELTEPKVNWRDQLRDFYMSVCAGRDSSSWSRPNRRWLAQDIYMPTPISEAVGEMVIGFDMSGSIDVRIQTMLLSEVQGLVGSVTPDKITLIYWDTEVSHVETYEPHQYDSMVSLTTPKGGGGTDAHCVKKYMDEIMTGVTISVVLMLTDGYLYGGFPNFGVPTLWGITTKEVATSGVTIHIEGE
jgi:predicted metal-dependent peptidase